MPGTVQEKSPTRSNYPKCGFLRQSLALRRQSHKASSSSSSSALSGFAIVSLRLPDLSFEFANKRPRLEPANIENWLKFGPNEIQTG